MKSHLIVKTIILMFVLVGIALGQDSNTLPAAPKLIIAQTEFSFGEIKTGGPLTHTFVLKNEGTADLLILKVTPS